MVRSQKPDMVCLQETKLEWVDRRLCSLLWEGNEFEWAHKNVERRSGGLIVLWRKGCFELISVFQGNNYLGIECLWGKERFKFSLINIYSSCI